MACSSAFLRPTIRTSRSSTFARYKRSTVLRRLVRRMQVHRLDSLEEYYQLFRENPEEMPAGRGGKPSRRAATTAGLCLRSRCQCPRHGTQRALPPGDISRRVWLKINGKAFFDKADKPIRLVSTVQDVSAAKAAEARQNLLLAELSHRVKNMLCVVQSLARQTLRDRADEAALDAFDARLRALAGAHELLITSEWTGADLADLIRHQITSSLGDGASQIKARGPAGSLPPQLATAFGLLLHELATNALKLGSLTSPKGTVEVTWELSAAKRGPQVLHLHWEERGGPRVQQPESKGFGSYLIDHGLPEASVERDFRPTGLVCSIDVRVAGTEASA